jgi:hypothetical protein
MGTPHQQNIQRRMSSQSITMSPGSLQHTFGAGFTSDLPGNLRGMFPQDTDFAGFFAGGQGLATTTSNDTQAPFQLQRHGDLRELRARRQSRGRNSQKNPTGPKKEAQGAAKREQEPKSTIKTQSAEEQPPVKSESAADELQLAGSDPLHLYTGSQSVEAVKLETSLPDDAVSLLSPNGLEGSNLEVDNFQQFYDADDFTTDFFNSTSNFDQFDFDSFLQIPASQPDVENESLAS